MIEKIPRHKDWYIFTTYEGERYGLQPVGYLDFSLYFTVCADGNLKLIRLYRKNLVIRWLSEMQTRTLLLCDAHAASERCEHYFRSENDPAR